MTDRGPTKSAFLAFNRPADFTWATTSVVRNFVDLQGDYEVYCVVDLHAITVWQDPTKLADQTREIIASLPPASTPRPPYLQSGARTLSWAGCSTVWRGWAGSTV